MVTVEALDTYKKKLIKDKELGRIPKVGEQFEVSKERLDILLGNNRYGIAFVKEIIKEDKEKTKSKKSKEE